MIRNHWRLRSTFFVSILVLVVVVQDTVQASFLSYGAGREKGEALVCRPEGSPPFPAVVFNHGLIVDLEGYEGARKRGYMLDEICQALANDGFLAFIPIRKSGVVNLPGHAREASSAIDYVKTRSDVDASRVALMGFSRGALLTLMAGVERQDLRALVILAPAPGRGHLAAAVEGAGSIAVPVLLLVDASDSSVILEGFEMLERALRKHRKDLKAVRYDRGGGHRLFWKVGYYWKDVREFLTEKLAEGPPR